MVRSAAKPRVSNHEATDGPTGDVRTGYATARWPMMAKRSLLEIQSIAATATKIIRIRNDTVCHYSTRICSAN